MAGQIVLSPKAGPLIGEVDIPISKSIANRLLVLSALAENRWHLDSENLPDDVRLMNTALSSTEEKINLENAGTAMRFLTAYFAIQNGRTVILDGNEAMRKRPIDSLVDALNSIGADINYEAEVGFPPIRINGKKINGGRVEISGEVSSQFVSALMLIGSFLENGLEISVAGSSVSTSYLSLTEALINEWGGSVSINGDKISVPTSTINNQQSTIETDWSAASYFYAIAALRPGSELTLTGLSLRSSQGDKRMSSIMTQFGVTSLQLENGVKITSAALSQSARYNYDLSSQPDLVQTLACFHAVRGDEVEYTGIDHLKFKETDRLFALQSELKKFGVELVKLGNSWHQTGKADWNGQPISTYGDHRMAMAFSILANQNSGLIITDPEVVSKSFPEYWNQLASLT